MTQALPLIDPQEIIARFGTDQLCRTAELYYANLSPDGRESLLAKPFRSLTEVQHLLIELSALINGLELAPGMDVLEFGAGFGWASRLLNQMRLHVIATDVSTTALDMGRELLRRQPVFGNQPPLEFLHFNGHRFDLPDACVDRIFCLDALHHTPNVAEVFADMARILRPGGMAGFVEPGPNHSKTIEAQHDMRLHNVLENDIDVNQLNTLARTAGFDNIKVAIYQIGPNWMSLDQYNQFPTDAAATAHHIENINWRSKNFPIFVLSKPGTSTADSRVGTGLKADLRPEDTTFTTPLEQPLKVRLYVTNTSDRTWLASGNLPGSVNVAAQILRAGDTLPREGRGYLSATSLPPNATARGTITLTFPQRGTYHITLDLVAEHVTWFKDQGNPPAQITVTVT
jgi:ubiquinone/menaquinone biosynthesis C-methylase UbiE